MDETNKIHSTSCEAPLQVLDSPEPKPGMCELTNSVATSSTSDNESISIMTLESMPNIKSKAVVQRELHLPSATDKNLDEAIRSITSSVEQILAEQEKCVIPYLQLKEEVKALLNYLNISETSTEELVNTLKSLSTSKELIIIEKTTNSLFLLIQTALRSIKEKLHHPFSADKVVLDTLLSLKLHMKRIIPEQRARKIIITKIKESLVKKLPLPASAKEEVVHEFHSLNSSMEFILAEQNPQDIIFTNFQELLMDIFEQLPSRKIRASKAENTGEDPGRL